MAEQKLHQRFRLLRFKSTVKMQNWAITVKVSCFFLKKAFFVDYSHMLKAIALFCFCVKRFFAINKASRGIELLAIF